MKFQLLDASFIYNNEGWPEIVLYGIAENGSPVTKYVHGFLHYFYIGGSPEITESYITTLAAKIGILVKTHVVTRFKPLGYQSEQSVMLKVYVKNPKDVRLLQDFCLHDGHPTYESDIIFRDRFMIDHGISGAGWIIAPKDTHVDHSDIIGIDDKSNAPLHIMSLDIEALPKEDGRFPTADEDPAILISLSFSPAWRGLTDIVMVAKEINCTRNDVIVCRNEKEMLKKLIFITAEYDPDIIAGYNINGFDMPYLVDRSKQLNMELRMSRDGRAPWCKSFMTKHSVSIGGRIVLDMLPAIKAIDKYRLKSYTLANVAKEILHSEKLDVKAKEMRALWEGSAEDLKRFIQYSRRDSWLVMKMVKDLKVLDKYFALSKASGAFLQVVINGGQSNMIEARLSREFMAEKRVMGIKSASVIGGDEEFNEENTITGAIVLDPDIGLTEDVAILDYKSLYPTIMIAHNLCYSTEIIDEEPVSGEIITSPSGGRFVSPETYRGIVPRVLEKLLAERLAAKKAMKLAKNPEERDALDAKQYAMKILLNSMYGYSGYTRARLFSPIIANSVTSYGRENLLRTCKIVDEIGAIDGNKLKVISGDSITGDRCVTIRQKGLINVVPIEKLFNSQDIVDTINSKEYAIVHDIDALTHDGWKPITSIMRHFTTKKIYRVTQKLGESVVTEDHSFMDSNLSRTKPTDMINKKMYACTIPNVLHPLDSIDLFDYVKHFEHHITYKGQDKISKFEIYNNEYLKFGWTNRKNEILVKRYIAGNDLIQLCILLGGYITNGSSTFAPRLGASICDNNPDWLTKMQHAYHSLFINTKTSIIESNKKIRTLPNGTVYKDETRKLQMMNNISAAVFTALCGHGAANKKLPNFAYNLENIYQQHLWKELLAGDGHINKSGQFEYSTISTQLASGINALLNIMRIPNHIKFRVDKHEYTLREFKHDKSSIQTTITEQPSNCYVYDLSVSDAHTFVDSMGQILLHNTDSVFISIDKHLTFEEAKAYGTQIAKTITAGLPSPMELVFEAYAKRILIIAKKHYAMYRFEDPDKGVIKAKGIETVRRDWCNMTAKTLTTCLEKILIDGSVDDALNHAREAISAVKSPNDDLIKDLIMTRTLTKKPENYDQAQPHSELMKKLAARGINKYSLGDRIPFVIVRSQRKKGPRKESMTVRAEDPEYAVENNIPLDTDYYVHKQLLPPLTRIFSSFNINEQDLMQNSRQHSIFAW